MWGKDTVCFIVENRIESFTERAVLTDRWLKTARIMFLFVYNLQLVDSARNFGNRRVIRSSCIFFWWVSWEHCYVYFWHIKLWAYVVTEEFCARAVFEKQPGLLTIFNALKSLLHNKIYLCSHLIEWVIFVVNNFRAAFMTPLLSSLSKFAVCALDCF